MGRLHGLPHCTTCGSSARGIFCQLSGSHVARLDREKVTRVYEKGQVVFYEGNPGEYIYCIYAGGVKIYKVGSKVREAVIRLLGPGDVLGYRAVLSDEPYAATAECTQKTTVCAISKAVITDILREDPPLCLTLLSKLAVELRVSEDQMVAQTQDPVRRRTARFLVWLQENYGEDLGRSHAAPRPAPRIALPIPHEDMARMIGTTPETLSRVLHDLADRKILEVERRTIAVRDPRALRLLAAEDNIE